MNVSRDCFGWTCVDTKIYLFSWKPLSWSFHKNTACFRISYLGDHLTEPVRHKNF